MAEHGYHVDDDELAERLRAYWREWTYPPTPDLGPIVYERIRGRSRTVAGWSQRRIVLAGAALVVLLCAATLLVPDTRRTVAGWLDLPGVTFYSTSVEDRPALGGSFQIGEPVTLAEAREAVAFDVLTPDLAWLDGPDEVYLDTKPKGGAVTLVYHASDRLPPAEPTGVGLLLGQFQGELNPGMWGKGLPDGVQLETFEINGQLAFWISGTPHTFSYFDPDERYVQETIRLAGNTLLWQAGGLTLRLESDLDRERAVEIAESMR